MTGLHSSSSFPLSSLPAQFLSAFFPFFSPYFMSQTFYLPKKQDLPMTTLSHCSHHLPILFLLSRFSLPLQNITSLAECSPKASQIGRVKKKKGQNKQTKKPNQNQNCFSWLRLQHNLDVTYWSLDHYPDICPLTLLIKPRPRFGSRVLANQKQNQQEFVVLIPCAQEGCIAMV